MTWRLKAIALYERDGDAIEILEFRTHGLNIISGDSQTGKSAVIDIVNYGLMSRACPIPKGPIRESCSAIGIHLAREDDELLVIREVPGPGRKSSGRSAWKQGRNLEFPEKLPKLNWDRRQTRSAISAFTGIVGVDVLTDTKDVTTELRQAATIRHAVPFLFQPQDVIANRYTTFPGIDRVESRRHTLDALPFLLGLETPDTLQARVRLRELKSRLRVLQMKDTERRRRSADGLSRGSHLWRECHRAGLVAGDPPADIFSLLESLRSVKVSDEQRVASGTAIPDIDRLEKHEQDLRRQLNESRRHLKDLKDFEATAKLHQSTADEQSQRIRISDLLPDASEITCPVCMEGRFDGQEATKRMSYLAAQLEAVRALPMRFEYKTTKAIESLEHKIEDLLRKHMSARSDLEGSLRDINRSANAVQRSRDVDILWGRVREYVSSLTNYSDIDSEDEMGAIEVEIKRLETSLRQSQSRLSELQYRISTVMTKLARNLDIEFKAGRANLSLQDLSISVQIDPDEDEMTPLNEIGSGANWVSYHVSAALALHDHIARENTPVPRLLILDQPSQAWFPPARRKAALRPAGRSLLPSEPRDLERVRALFELVAEVTSKHQFSQVILLDHAYFTESWFEDHVIREWRNGAKLVPPAWIKRAGRSL